MKASDYNLIEKYLDGTATPEEFAVVEGRLRTDPEMRLELLREAGFDAQLRLLLKTAPVVYRQAATVDEVIDVEEPATASRKTIQWRPAWMWIPVAAAAVALVTALVLPHVSIGNRRPVTAGNRTRVPKAAPAAQENVTHPLVVKEVTNIEDPAVTPSSPAVAAVPENGTDSGNVAPVKDADPTVRPAVPGTRAAVVAQQNPPAAGVAAPHVESPLIHARKIAAVTVTRTPPKPDAAPESPVVAAPAAAAVASVRAAGGGQIVSANGNAFITRNSTAAKQRQEIHSGDDFQAGDLVETGPMSGLSLRYKDGSTVRLYGETQLTLNQNEQNRNLLLSSGAVDLRVQPLGQGNNLTVRTAHIEARVVGTEFRVMTDDKGSWVGVKTGRVEVVRFRANGEVLLLDPGYYAASYRGWPPTLMSDPSWRGKCQALTGSPKYQ